MSTFLLISCRFYTIMEIVITSYWLLPKKEKDGSSSLNSASPSVLWLHTEPIRGVFGMQTESFLAKYTRYFKSFLYLCTIILKQKVMIDEKILKEKAGKYLVCFIEQCPKNEHCLRWIVGQHVPCEQLSITCVNSKITKKEMMNVLHFVIANHKMWLREWYISMMKCPESWRLQ